MVKAGDTVLVGPGVYYESVQLRAKGTADQPITFKTDQILKGRVILTGADQAIRTKTARWTRDDSDLSLYWIPWDKPMPMRCLYSGADLYPYSSLQHLRQFVSMDAAQMRKLAPAGTPEERIMRGPQHGYALDEQTKRLYVRLHQSGRYGPADPNEHLMCVSPPFAEKYLKSHLEPPEFNFGIIGQGNGHVIVDGFTFETPAVVAVYTEANDVLVRNSWFIGCHSGVGGTAQYGRSKDYGYEECANRVTVEQCEFTQFATYDDGCETIRLSFEEQSTKEDGVALHGPHFWQRKDTAGACPTRRLPTRSGSPASSGATGSFGAIIFMMPLKRSPRAAPRTATTSTRMRTFAIGCSITRSRLKTMPVTCTSIATSSAIRFHRSPGSR